MKLYDFMKITEEDYDTYDTVYDASVTVCYIEEKKANDSYDKFCIELMKKIELVKGNCNHGLIVEWTKLITDNMEKFREFTKENWYEDCQFEDDEDEFIYQWINELHGYMAGNVSEYFYETLVEFVETLEA